MVLEILAVIPVATWRLIMGNLASPRKCWSVSSTIKECGQSRQKRFWQGGLELKERMCRMVKNSGTKRYQNNRVWRNKTGIKRWTRRWTLNNIFFSCVCVSV